MGWRSKCGGFTSWLLFFFNDTATTEIYTLSLHDALPICHEPRRSRRPCRRAARAAAAGPATGAARRQGRSEEHTSELQSHLNLVCRLLLEKKKETTPNSIQQETTIIGIPNQIEAEKVHRL